MQDSLNWRIFTDQPATQADPWDMLRTWTETVQANFGPWMQASPGGMAQQMMREFVEAMHELSRQTVQEPQRWAALFAQHQQRQAELWLRTLDARDQNEAPATAPARRDRRFTGESWHTNPAFDYVRQSYLLNAELLATLADTAEHDSTTRQKVKFYTGQLIDALSPSNFAATNPEVLERAMETGGQSITEGLQNLAADLKKGRISMTDESAFRIGENIATTPGQVVFENELLQLIQYQPLTDKVSNRPLVIVPPFINKFYILDLQPENSFVRYALEQGNAVFMVSWVNPGPAQRDLSWDDYIESGMLAAFGAARKICRARQLNVAGWCVGGTLLASTLAVLAARGDKSVASATFLTTLIDFSEPGDLGVFIDEQQVAEREVYVNKTGLLPGKDLALIFSMLRSNDLIWSYVVNNYLKGKSPAAFDLLYWNSDPTNLPAQLYISYIRNMYLENKLVQPGALEFCGAPIDLGHIETPSYFLSTLNDHIAPWIGTFPNIGLFAGPSEFVLGASGHIAGVINPASRDRRNYWIGGERGHGPDHWLETAEKVPGSWWRHWSAWLKAQGGTPKQAPGKLGNAQHKPIEPAPGRYVHKRAD